MEGAAALGIVFGWIAGMTMLAAATHSSTAARLRRAGLVLLYAAALTFICYFYRDWPGVVIAITGAGVGGLLAAASRAALAQRRTFGAQPG